MNLKIVLGACVLFTPTIFPAVLNAAPRKKTVAKVAIVWRTDMSVALKEARKTGKPIFIDVYTDWCGPCKMLDETVYLDKSFIAASRAWVMVKINPEKSSAGAKLAQKYKVNGFPTFVFTDSSGKSAGTFSGASTASWKTWLRPEMDKAQKKMGVLSA